MIDMVNMYDLQPSATSNYMVSNYVTRDETSHRGETAFIRIWNLD